MHSMSGGHMILTPEDLPTKEVGKNIRAIPVDFSAMYPMAQ